MYRPYFSTGSRPVSIRTARSVAWTHRICGSSIIARWSPPAFKDSVDFDTIDGAATLLYAIPNMRVD